MTTLNLEEGRARLEKAKEYVAEWITNKNAPTALKDFVEAYRDQCERTVAALTERDAALEVKRKTLCPKCGYDLEARVDPATGKELDDYITENIFPYENSAMAAHTCPGCSERLTIHRSTTYQARLAEHQQESELCQQKP